ncbi:UPF0184 protein-like [Haliotis rufescens]|uniref:UPF0184 protein-like n=1 Tax=Haliotis rufescens TaxID=6454 RepID=UPI001EB058C4|nr:UPF0184 protein-like [Haliotis rufescens]
MSHDSKMADGDDLDEDRKTIDVNDSAVEMNEEDDGDDLYDGSDLESLVDGCAQEYSDLNNTLDKLDECLNTLEERSDDLYSKFKDLLESSRQARQELEEERRKGEDGNVPDSETKDSS